MDGASQYPDRPLWSDGQSQRWSSVSTYYSIKVSSNKNVCNCLIVFKCSWNFIQFNCKQLIFFFREGPLRQTFLNLRPGSSYNVTVQSVSAGGDKGTAAYSILTTCKYKWYFYNQPTTSEKFLIGLVFYMNTNYFFRPRPSGQPRDPERLFIWDDCYLGGEPREPAGLLQSMFLWKWNTSTIKMTASNQLWS